MESESPPTGEPAAEAAAKKPESWWETLRFFGLLFLAAVALRSFVIAPFSIPSGSMLPNMMVGDYLFVSKWSYGYSRYSLPFGLLGFDGRVFGGLPERGDVVVFRYPGRDEDWVKRVIGLPGDEIEVRRGIVILNGEPLARRRIADFPMPVSENSPCRALGPAVRELPDTDGGTVCAYPRFRETLPNGRSYDIIDQDEGTPGDTFGPIVVPEGHVFMMGDNRDDSLDSRFPVVEDPRRSGVGLVPVENLLGRARIAFWSTDGSSEWLLPWTWFSAARWERIGWTW